MDRRRAPYLTKIVASAMVAARGWAALEGTDPAPQVVRLAGTHPGLAVGAQDFRGNPATAAMAPATFESGAGITRPLGLDGLQEQAGWASWVAAVGGNSSGAARLGWRGFSADDLYRDDAMFGTLAWRWRNVGVGITGEALRCDYGENVVGSAFGASMGAALRWKDFVLGASTGDISIFHAEPTWMNEPTETAIGLGFAPHSEAWRTALTTSFREGQGWDWRMAQEVTLPAGLDAGVGIGVEPFRMAGGIGWSLGWSRLDAAVEGDPVLGWQSHVSLGLAIR